MSQGGNLTSLLSSLTNDAENGTFMISTGSTPSLFIDRYSKVGINTTTPSSQLEVASSNGSCIRLRYGTSTVSFADIFMTSGGNLAINPKKTGSEITTTSSLNLLGHNGSSVGLKLGGDLVAATAEQLNYIAVVPGVASASKALVLDSAQNVSGINSITASVVVGTLHTVDQPNITSVGTLTSLTISGELIVDGNITVNGTTTGGSTEGGSGGSTGSVDIPTYLLSITPGTAAASKALVIDSSKNISGVSSFGTSTIVVSGFSIGTEAGFLSGATAGTAVASKALILNSSRSVSGIVSISATSLAGTLTTTDQPNITSIGALNSITINGYTIESEASYISEVIAGTAVNSKALVLNSAGSISGISSLSSTYLTGTILTGSQPNITTVGPLSSLSVSGVTIGSEIGYLAGAVEGSAANSKVLVLNSLGSISGITSLSSTHLTGTLQTGDQPNITSIGTLSSLAVTNGISASTLTGTLQTAAQPNITSIGILSSLAVTNGISASSLTGTLQTAAQPNITSIGILSSLAVTNGITATNLTGTLQTAAQPNITSIGILSSLAVTNGITATNLTGTLQTAAQPNITSIGTLSTLAVTNGITASSLTGTLQTASQPNITSIGALTSISIGGSTIGPEVAFLSDVVPGAAAVSKVLVLNSSGTISGIDSLSATSLTGTLQTAAQPNITSIGTLSSLTITNGITATSLTGTLQTASQPNITSIGTLSTISIGGSTIGSEAAFLSGAVAGTATNSKVMILSNIGAINGISSLTATNLTGTIQTASQPNITSVGDLSTISIGGSTIGSEAAFLSGVVPGTASNSKVLVVNSSGSIMGITSLTATSLSGTLQTTAQPNITSVGTLGSLIVGGSTTISSTTNASSSVDGGALTVSGGLAIAKNAYVGGQLISSNTSDSTSASTGSLYSAGGVGIAKSLFVGSDATIGGTLTVTGSFAVSGTTSYTGSTEFSDTTESVSAATGSIFTSGGIGVAKSIYVGTNATIDGNVGIGVATPPQNKLEVNGDSLFTGTVGVNSVSPGFPLYVSGVYSPSTPTSYISINSYGSLSTSSVSPVSVSIACEGRMLCNGEIDIGSDFRIKDNISIIDPTAVDEFIDGIVPIRFNYKNEPGRMNFGYIAQDIAKNQIEELISVSANDSLEEYTDEDGFVSPAGIKFGVITGNIIPLLHMKVKSLSTENKELKNQVRSLQDLIDSLMIRVGAIESQSANN